MAFHWRTLLVVTSLFVSRACRLYNTGLIHDNMTCPGGDNETLLKDITRHECIIHCIHEVCHLLSYIDEDQICKLTVQPCEVLEPSQGVTIQALRTSQDSECFKWVTYESDDVIPPRVVENSSVRSTHVLVRFLYEGDLLPGKLEYNILQNVYSAYNRMGVPDSAPNLQSHLVGLRCHRSRTSAPWSYDSW